MDMSLAQRRERICAQTELFTQYDTPLYVFFEEDLRRNYRHLRTSLDDYYPDSRVHFAVKSNYNLGILSVLQDTGCGAEAYSGGELTATLKAGFDPDDVLLTGSNRDRRAIERALATGVRYLLVDNANEFEKIEAAAVEVGTKPLLLVRGNPAMTVPTHPGVATATIESKFGLDIESGRAMTVARRASESDHVTLSGIQLHIGSQIHGIEPYAVATTVMLDFAADIRDELGVTIDVLDMGGGIPVPYDETVPSADDIIETIAEAITTGCADHDLDPPRLFLEPGRHLVGNAGMLLGTVGVIKETPHATFAVLDVGTNAVSSYWPYPIYALGETPTTDTYDVAGPLCYTGDIIQEDVRLPTLERGDILAVDRIGAYSLGSASHTNAEPIPPVVLVREDGDFETIRIPEDCTAAIEKDRIPPDLA